MTAPKPRRRTIRFAIVAVVCLLLGAATTVGVAWRASQPTSASIEPPSPWEPWTITLEAWGVTSTWTERGWGDRDRSYTRSISAGLPMPALKSSRTLPVYGSGQSVTASPWKFYSWSEGIGMPSSWQIDGNCFPIEPIWPGFALDTALYAAAWYLLLFTPLPLIRAGRRRFRVSRGMCGSCGYDLNASTNRPCPECGAGSGAKA